MDTTNKTTSTPSLTPSQVAFRKKMLNAYNFRLFTLTQVPLGFFAGMRLRELTAERCVTSLPYKWLNKNPFRSIYFAAQSMAAELSTAAFCLMAVQGQDPSIAFIIVDMKARYPKKATKDVTFTCEDGPKVMEAVRMAKETGEAVTVETKTTGRMADGTVIAEFSFTWSFKQRKKR